jgi:hypothetical protein
MLEKAVQLLHPKVNNDHQEFRVKGEKILFGRLEARPLERSFKGELPPPRYRRDLHRDPDFRGFGKNAIVYGPPLNVADVHNLRSHCLGDVVRYTYRMTAEEQLL